MLKHSVRGDFSDVSGYFDSKNSAFVAFNLLLAAYRLHMKDTDLPGDEGHKVFDVFYNTEVVGVAFIAWEREGNDIYELVGCLV